jgi:hypothetical protein
MSTADSGSMSTAESRPAVASLGDLAFVLGFTAYTSVSVLLLLGGLATMVGGDQSPAARAVEEMGGDISAISRHHAVQVALDYLLSAVNLALGVLLVWLRPRHWTARLLGIALVGTAAAFNLSSHGLFVALPESWVNVLHFLLHAAAAIAYLHALLLFPDSRLQPGWPRRFLAVIYVVVGLELLIILLDSAGVTGAGRLSILGLLSSPPFGTPENPEATLADVVAADASFLVFFTGLLVPVVGLIALVQRYRMAPSALERQQTRLLAWALTAAFIGALAFVGFAIGSGIAGATGFSAGMMRSVYSWVFRIFPVLFAAIPLALFTGILRYRLWDVDRAINRVLVYGLLTGVLACAYLVCVTVLGWFFNLVIGVNARFGELAVGFSMLAVAALFGPLRRRIQAEIDRRFYRQRYDAVRTLQTLSAQLREEVDLRRVGDDVLDAVEQTVSPVHTSLWLQKS